MNLLSFGAGEEQIYGIVTAKRMGYKVVAIDGNENSVGFEYADEFYCVDLKDKTKILKIAKEKNIKAIIPSPIGSILSNVGFLNDELKLKGISEEAALNCTDKKIMNNILKYDIELPKQIEANGYNEIKDAIKIIGIPCIVKPKKGSGSRGVVAIFDEDNIEKLVQVHLKDSNSKSSIVEEFIEGKEYGIDGIIIDGEFRIIMTRDKTLTDLPYRQEVSYTAPSDLSISDLIIVEDYLKKICKLLKLNHCIIHCDLIYQDKKPKLIEISGRPSGLKISEKLIPECISINMIENILNYMLDKKYSFDSFVKKNILLQFIDVSQGRVLDIPSFEELTSENIIHYNSKIKKGDILNKIKNGTELYNRGYFILSADNKQDLYNLSLDIKNKFKIKKIN